MIENYFKLGTRYRWRKPANVDGPRDGTIVNSVRVTAPLSYICLGTVLDHSLMQLNLRQMRREPDPASIARLGLHPGMPIQHQWLDYVPGRTSRVQMTRHDVLTGFMSGCLITRWQENGVTYAGHVGTVESDPNVNRAVKTAYRNVMPRNVTGFNPLRAWLNDLPALCRRFEPVRTTPQICALVTTRGDFYSLVLFNDGTDEWYCGGIKRGQSLNYEQLSRALA